MSEEIESYQNVAEIIHYNFEEHVINLVNTEKEGDITSIH